jgi:hypothetical protein
VLWFFSKYGWLSQMPADFRTAVLKNCVRQRYEAGASLFVAGDPPRGYFRHRRRLCRYVHPITPALVANVPLPAPQAMLFERPRMVAAYRLTGALKVSRLSAKVSST